MKIKNFEEIEAWQLRGFPPSSAGWPLTKMIHRIIFCTLGPPSRSQASNRVRSIDLDVVYYLKKYEEHYVSNREP